MNPVPIQLFQAAATAIPTLLIALAVSLKRGHEVAATVKQHRGWNRTLRVWLMGALPLGIVMAEAIAFIAIANGGGIGYQGFLVVLCIMLMMYLIAVELYFPILRGLGDKHILRSTQVLFAVFFLTGCYAVGRSFAAF